MIFEEKYFARYILLTDQVLLSACLPLIFEISGNVFIEFFVVLVCDVTNFKIYLTSLSSQESQDKI